MFVVQVYTETTANRTFRNTLADMLGVVRAAPACLERVEALLHIEASAAKPGQHCTGTTRDPVSSKGGQLAANPGAAGTTTEKGLSVVNTLMDVLACDSPSGLLCDSP
jgi:hypothetical protein